LNPLGKVENLFGETKLKLSQLLFDFSAQRIELGSLLSV
jgi:hypothetical protein